MAQTEDSRPCKRTAVQCRKCSSYSASVVDISPPYARCRCTDCGTIYNYRMREITNGGDAESADQHSEEQDFMSRSRKTKADSRARIAAATPPQPGFNTAIIEEAIAAGPAGVRSAQKIAMRHAKKMHEEAVDYWRKTTDFLKAWTDSPDSFYRARARYALVWRPRFLAALSMTHCVQLSCRSAKVSRDTAYEHRKADREFARQWDEAQEHALDLLHARVWQRSLEGDLEPIMHMGVPVAYIRKFSDKLQIELLRAWKPDRFKTAGVNVNVGTRGDVFVLTETQRAELKAINRKWLLESPIPERGVAQHNVVAQPMPASGALAGAGEERAT